MPHLLVEIGTEELPLASLDVLDSHLASTARKVFEKNRISHGDIKTETTPRRIALFVEGLAQRQEDQMLEISGPSYDKAYQHDGTPLPALEGFLRSKNAKPEDVVIKETAKGKFVSVRQKIAGKPVALVLSSVIQEIFSVLPFPKLMRWDATGFRFPRPIRWFIVLLDKKVLSFSLADVKSGYKSRGHRFLAPKSFKILKADWPSYLALLGRAHVVLSLEERKEIIRKGLQRKYGQKNYDEELVHITAQLVEEPFFLQGNFSKNYLDLPNEVLASCMKKNQKIFACYDSKGILTNRFVAILNGKRKGLARIKFDYENVLESRLRDARYFYEADTKEPLEAKLPLLEQITYLGKLGSMRDKTERLEKMAARFSEFVGRLDIKNDLGRVARLSKIDLMTHLVYEFPDLQGVVGREYALESREKQEVAKAIGSQYLPKNLAQDFHELKQEITPLGALFGIMDRLDLLVGAFGTGIEPTGSQDPFALRRAGGALVKLIRAFGFHFSLSEAISANVDFYGKSLSVPREDFLNRLGEFLKERVIFEIGVKPGDRPYEILRAVFSSSFEDLADVYQRHESLMRLYKNDAPAFLKAAKVVERTGNILKGAKTPLGNINPALFQTPLEHRLFELFEKRNAEISEFLRRREYEKAAGLFGGVFHEPIHEFFNQVMVNVEDAAIRTNRQALMRQINRLFTETLADLSMLSRLDQE